MPKIIIIHTFLDDFNKYYGHLDGPNNYFNYKLIKNKYYNFINEVQNYETHLLHDVDVMQ